MRSARNGIAPPAWEKMKLMSWQRAKVPLNSRLHGAGRVEWEIQRRCRNFGLALVAGCVGRVEIDRGFAPVQLIEDRCESRVAGVAVAIRGKQADAVGFKIVQRVRYLGEAGIDIGQRQRGKHAEPGWVVLCNFGGIFVAVSAEIDGFLGFAKPQTGCGD